MYARYESLQIPTNGLPISSALHLSPATDGLYSISQIGRLFRPEFTYSYKRHRIKFEFQVPFLFSRAGLFPSD